MLPPTFISAFKRASCFLMFVWSISTLKVHIPLDTVFLRIMFLLILYSYVCLWREYILLWVLFCSHFSIKTLTFSKSTELGLSDCIFKQADPGSGGASLTPPCLPSAGTGWGWSPRPSSRTTGQQSSLVRIFFKNLCQTELTRSNQMVVVSSSGSRSITSKSKRGDVQRPKPFPQETKDYNVRKNSVTFTKNRAFL